VLGVILGFLYSAIPVQLWVCDNARCAQLRGRGGGGGEVEEVEGVEEVEAQCNLAGVGVFSPAFVLLQPASPVRGSVAWG
jgi:hypothetical protein